MSRDPADIMTDAQHPKLLFFDLEDHASAQTPRAEAPAPRRRVITTVDDQVHDLRHNVQDSAEAIVSWVAAVCDHDGPDALDDVLDRCLRPGPDVERVNYAAIAEQVNRCLNVNLSAKQVRTAIQHLRRREQAKVNAMPEAGLQDKLQALLDQLQSNYTALIEAGDGQDESLRRAVAIQVLGAVRAAAGQVIDNAFGEGIPETIDIDELESRFLDFVRDMVREQRIDQGATGLAGDLQKLLMTLSQYDGSGESNMRLVVTGARVVGDLQGPDSLPGLMGQLNVIVAGRYLLDGELYCAELTRLAEAAGDLHGDAATGTLMNWVHRLPEDQRLPTPLRVRSYCLNNAATHILERVYRDQYDDPEPWLERAGSCLQQMRQRDSGFRLIQTTHLIQLVVNAKRSGDASAIQSHFEQLGEADALKVLEDLARFENAEDIVRDARRHAVAALPALQHRLIYLTD